VADDDEGAARPVRRSAAVIFVTVGTHTQPFTRLVESLASLPADELIVQHGPAAPPAGVLAASPFMSHDDLQRHLWSARAVITHAGVGSILCALAVGHTPVVVPRLRRYGEHVDDHQLELMEALSRRGDVIGVYDLEGLPEAVASAPVRQPTDDVGDLPLHAALREALLGEPDFARHERGGPAFGARRFLGWRVRTVGH
jgi:UDP-N-acetylglucosamine transferase subunit ALG13